MFSFRRDFSCRPSFPDSDTAAAVFFKSRRKPTWERRGNDSRREHASNANAALEASKVAVDSQSKRSQMGDDPFKDMGILFSLLSLDLFFTLRIRSHCEILVNFIMALKI